MDGIINEPDFNQPDEITQLRTRIAELEKERDAAIAEAVKAEREACAKVCEYRGGFELAKDWRQCAAAIRARSVDCSPA